MAWYNSSWLYRVKITVDADEVDADLTNFPVYVNLAGLPAGFHAHVKSDGGDIRITTADQTTEIAREVVVYDAGTDTGELHFLAPSLANTTDTDFYIYYGNAGASDYAVGAIYGRNAVWADYALVHHFNESSGNPIDATGGYSGTWGGSGMPDSITGKVGNGQLFSSTGFVQHSNDSGLNVANPSFSFWYKSSSNPTTNQFLWSRRSAITNGNTIFALQTSTDTWHWDTNGNSSRWNTGKVLPTDDQWHFYTFTYDGTTRRFYDDGTQFATSNNSSGMGNATIGARVGANTTANNGYVIRNLDEFRLKKSTSSADWIAAEYSNQNAPGTFYAVGAEEGNTTSASLSNIQSISNINTITL